MIKKAKEIILFSPSIHTGGGTERVLVSLANELSNFSYKVIILTYTIGKEKLYAINESIEIENYWFGQLKSKNSHSILIKFVNKLLGAIFLERFINAYTKLNDSIIISFSNGITIDCYQTKFRKNLIAFEHLPFWITEKYPRLQQKIKSIYPKLKKVIVLTEQERRVYNSLNCHNVEVIPNAYSFTPDEPAKLNNKIVLSIGHFNEQKRRDLLVKAWHIVIEKHPDWKLVIIGDGPQKSETIQLIEGLGLTNSIRIKQPTSQIIEEYLDASIYVKSSEYEALPMVLIEAKICGLACVSFDIVSGPREIINDNQDGFLVPFPDTNILAEKINFLIENESIRKEFGKLGRKDVLNRYSPEKIYSLWLNFITEITNT